MAREWLNKRLPNKARKTVELGPQTNFADEIAPFRDDPDGIFKFGRTENDLRIAKHIRRNMLQTITRKTSFWAVNLPSLAATTILIPTWFLSAGAGVFGLMSKAQVSTVGTFAAVSAGVWGLSTAEQLVLRLSAHHERKKARKLAEEASEIKGMIPEVSPMMRRQRGNMVEGIVDYKPSYMSALAMRMWGRKEETAEKVSLALESALALGVGEITGNALATANAIASATHTAHVLHATRVGHGLKIFHHAHTAHKVLENGAAVKGAAVAKGLALAKGVAFLKGYGIYKGVEVGLKEFRERKVRKKIRKEAEKFSKHVIEFAQTHPNFYPSRRTA